ncbi:MAG TPA: MtrB/PioB family outer membrane beta-barrel protein, partial [Burkholderiaceae bacterium]|nr:MtrB/PioB family outer membrane beta-barrel protein [Burkholderiaceae bacterium]
ASAGGRADFTPAEGVTLGFNADYAKDKYDDSAIGLTEARTYSYGGDFSAAFSDQTQVYAFVQLERIRSDQAGSQTFAQPDWTGRSEDRTNSAGVGVKHQAMGGKLELGAEATLTRMYNDVTVDAGVASPPFPTITTAVDRLRLRAVYQLQKDLSLVGSWWWERYDSADWHLDGVGPATVSNLLAFGDPSPRYKVNVLQLGVRYRF